MLLQFIGGDPDKDVAVLQLLCPEDKMHDLKTVSLGNSSNLLVGQKVFAIGNPFGLDHTLTGKLSMSLSTTADHLQLQRIVLGGASAVQLDFMW